MTTIWVAFLIAFIVAIMATRVTITAATRLGVVDKPDGYRRMHKRITPRLGGVAVFIGLITPIVLLSLFSEWSQVSRLLFGEIDKLTMVLVGAMLALILGVVDDVFDLRARWKLIWQIGIAIIAYYSGFGIEVISNPFGEAFTLGVFSLPVTVLWFVGCMNAVNLLDGLDGLASGMTLFVTLTMFLVSMNYDNTLGMFVAASISGAILGFLVFNFPPARIFLGDSGSMLLGFVVATLSLVGSSRKAEAAVALFVPVVALGLPIMDTGLSILRRWYKRLPIAEPDRGHIHHVLVSMGYSPRRAVLTLYLICLVFAVAALLITIRRNEIVMLVIGSLVISTMVSARIFTGVQLRDVMNKLASDKIRGDYAAGARAAIGRVENRFKSVASLASAWAMLEKEWVNLGVRRATLDTSDGQDRLVWSSDDGTKDTRVEWALRMSIGLDESKTGELIMFGAVQNDHPSLPEIPNLVEEFRKQVVAVLADLVGQDGEGGV